jgi:hypothetical protein
MQSRNISNHFNLQSYLLAYGQRGVWRHLPHPWIPMTRERAGRRCRRDVNRKGEWCCQLIPTHGPERESLHHQETCYMGKSTSCQQDDWRGAEWRSLCRQGRSVLQQEGETGPLVTCSCTRIYSTHVYYDQVIFKDLY